MRDMRIGLTGGASSAEKLVAQAKRADEEGFSAMWYPGGGPGDGASAARPVDGGAGGGGLDGGATGFWLG